MVPGVCSNQAVVIGRLLLLFEVFLLVFVHVVALASRSDLSVQITKS